MKNFRKVLALVLVVATLFSFTAMAGAAYKDEDKVSYDTAVDVLSAIGILNGYPDGTFQPTNTITRAEMAKMIATLSNAGDDVSELYASACDFADAKNNWAASYIAYCAKTDIVAGRSATTFDPDGKVTGLETAKMLLVVLGLDPAKQGYVGADWKVNVLRDAKEFGLLAGFAKGYKVDAAITREEAANMMLNALKAPLVIGYLSNNLVTITNKVSFDPDELVDSNKWSDLKVGDVITLIDAKNNGWTVLYGNVVVVPVCPLGTIYDGLTMTRAMDCYGRPGYVWSYRNAKGQVLLNSFYADAPDFTYTTTATLAADLKAEIEATGKYEYQFIVFEDGWYMGDEIEDAATGNGVVTEVYVDDANRDVVIVVINTYIGQVANVSTRNNTFDIVDVDGDVAMEAQTNSYGFKNGDMILFWICNGTISRITNNIKDLPFMDWEFDVVGVHGNEGEEDETLHNAVVVTPEAAYVSYAKWNKRDLTDTTVAGIIAGGKEKSYARNFGNIMDQNMDVMTDEQVKGNWNIYYDLNGYIMYWTEVSEETNFEYGYFVEHTWFRDKIGENQDGNIWACTADMVDFDAKYNKDVKVDVGMTAAMELNYVNVLNEEAGLLAKYSVGADGVKNYEDSADFILMHKVPMLNKNNPTIVEDELFGDDNTKYLVRTFNFDKGEYEYMAWTGFRNIDKDYASLMMPESVLNFNTYVQYFDENEDEVAEYVFIDAFFTTSSDMFYILGKEDYTAAWDKILTGVLGHHFQDYDVYSALVNGEKVLVCYDKDQFLGAKDLKRGLYEGMVVALGVNLTVEGGDYPLYIFASKVQPEARAGVEVAVSIENGLVTITHKPKDAGSQPKTTKLPASKDGVTVINVILDAEGNYSSVKVDKDVIDAEYPIHESGYTWFFYDGEGNVSSIIREVK